MSRYAAFCLGVLWLTMPAGAQETRKAHFDERTNALLMQGLVKASDILPPLVGKLGRPEAIVFEGLEAFPEAEVRETLAMDFDVVLAGHAQSALPEYLKTLERRLAAGYRKNGFPEAKISAAIDRQGEKIRVTIDEGESYRNGEIKIDGPPEVDAEEMARFLTEYRKPGNAMKKVASGNGQQEVGLALWNVGTTADFYHKPEKVYEEAVKAAFAAQGFFFPQFEAELKPAADGKADLWIRIKETGPKATIGQITVSGNRLPVEGQVIAFLGIKPGQPVDARQIEKWEQKLLRSNCFLEHKIAVLPAIAPDAPSELLVHVVEQPRGPHLGEKLTEQDELLVKAADWLSRWHENPEEDFVAVYRTALGMGTLRFVVVISPEKGLALDAEVLPAQGPPFRYTAVFGDKSVRLVSWHRQCQLEYEGGDQQITGWFDFAYAEDKDEPGKWNLNLGPQLQASSNGAGKPFRFGFEITPASAIGLARDTTRTVRRENGVLEIAKEGVTTQINAETGRLIAVVPSETKTRLADVKSAVIPKLEKDEGFMYFQAGAYERFIGYLDRETKNFHPAHNPQRPISSLAEFLLGETEQFRTAAGRDPSLEVIIKLVQLDALKPLDRLWVERHAPGEEPESFDLPISDEYNLQFFGLENRIPFGMGRAFGRMVFSLHGFLVPPESGPAQVGWNLALLCAGRPGAAFSNLEHLAESPEVGPLTCWYAGQVFGLLSKPWGRAFAEAGLQKLNDNQFRYEMDRLLPEESLLFELVGSVGNAVRQLDDDEFAQLAILWGEEAKHPAVPKLIEKIRQEKGTPSRSLMLETLSALWEIRGRTLVREKLEKLSKESAAAADPKEFTLDSLIPGLKPQKKESANEKPKKTRKLWDRDFQPLVPIDKTSD